MQDLHSEGWRDAIDKKKGLDIHHVRKAFKVGNLIGFSLKCAMCMSRENKM